MVDRIQTLFEMKFPDGLYVEAFTTHKGTLLTLNRKECTITITYEDALSILRTLHNYEKRKDV